MDVSDGPRQSAPGTRRRRASDLAAALAILALVFLADVLSGSEFDAAVAYVFPVVWAAWRVSRGAGVLVGICGAVADGVADLHIRRYALSVLPVAWNFAAQFTLLYVAAWVVGRMRAYVDTERSLHAQLRDSHGRLDAELRRVAEVQQSLLPRSLPELPGYGISVHYAPSVRAGGDYYDFFRLDDGRLGILVADASGHGPSAAVIMAMTRAVVFAGAPTHLHPETLLETANRHLVENLLPAQFVTACYAILDPTSGAIEYALAGHPRPILCDEEPPAAAEIGVPDGPPLGLEATTRYVRQTARLLPGDALVLYTDGLTDARGRDGAPVGEEGVLRRLLSRPGGASADFVGALVDLVRVDAGGEPVEDDVTIVAVSRARGSPA